MGPTLYAIYINCIVALKDQHTKMVLYADDTTAATELTKNKRINHQRIKNKAAEMQEYMNCHHLKFNSDKTQLLIKSKGRENIHSDMVLEMETGNIKQSEVVKVLGVYISRDELCGGMMKTVMLVQALPILYQPSCLPTIAQECSTPS